MIKAIIFDCYGVLVTDGWLPFKNAQFGHSDEMMMEAGDLNNQYNRDMIRHDEFIQGIADLASMPSAQVEQLIDANKINKKLFDYIHELKKSYKIGLLSNMGISVLETLFSKDQIAAFDEIALSFEIGYVKPDPRAYMAIASRLGVEADECLMVDDIDRNCAGAEDTGMRSVHYKDFDQFKADLDKVLSK